jgi:hypothetical protein
MTTSVEQHGQPRQLLVALLAAVLALVVGVGVGVDAPASSTSTQVAGSRVAAHELLAGPVVAAVEDIAPGESRRTTTQAVDVAMGSRVAPNTASPSAFSRTEALSGRASSRQVSEMADAMRTTGWDGPPIRVVEANGRRYVVDGHHRLEAARRAGIDVPYEVVDPATVVGPGQWSSLDDIIQDANAVGGNRLRT